MKSLLLLLLYAYICGSLLITNPGQGVSGATAFQGPSPIYIYGNQGGLRRAYKSQTNPYQTIHVVPPYGNRMEADGRIPTYGQRMEADGRIPTYGQPGVTASRTNPNAETVTLPADVEYKPLYLYDPEIVDRYGGNRIPTYGETGVTAVFTNPDRETVTLPADVEDQPLYLYDPEIVDRCSPSTLTSGPVCDTYSIRYKYNAETKECEKFTQRDCVPSPNSFETHQECEATCMVADLSDNSSPSS